MSEHTAERTYSIADLYRYAIQHGRSEDAKALERYLILAETPTKRPSKAWAEALRANGALPLT